MDSSQLKEEMRSSHADNGSPHLVEPKVKLDGDLAEQEKIEIQSKAVVQGEKEKFVTEWSIE